MIESLTIKGFRSFGTLEVTPLSRVNLFVGANNAGKTSVLEAIEILFDVRALWLGPLRRQETLFIGPGEGRQRYEVDPSHLFHGHDIEATRISIRAPSDNVGTLGFDCKLVDRNELRPELAPDWALQIGEHVADPTTEFIQLSNSQGMPRDKMPDPRSPSSFMSTELLDAVRLSEQWDRIVLTPEEDMVSEALRIVEPNMERIAFSSGHSGGIFVKFKGENRRIPLGSMGDGMKRLLALALGLAQAPHNLLLVDDIDTGLHHSVMLSMWHLVVETARRRKLQVFATTHSLDCVRALARLCEQHPEFSGDVAVHRIERARKETTMLSAEDLSIAARHHMEIR